MMMKMMKLCRWSQEQKLVLDSIFLNLSSSKFENNFISQYLPLIILNKKPLKFTTYCDGNKVMLTNMKGEVFECILYSIST